MANVLEISNLGGGYNRRKIIEDVNIQIPKGSITALIGLNGAGKSNLMTALNVLSKMILKPTKNIEEPLPYMPFRLDEDGINEPTKFTIRFIKQEKIYVYHIEYNLTDIILEELYIGKTMGKEKLYFKR